MSPLDQHADGRILASLLNGNDKQRFFIDIYLHDTWFPQRFSMPWSIYIGCHQGHSTGSVMPSQVAHQLTPVECFALGWIFHTTDRRFLDSIHEKGFIRRGRDALHFMYENDGGYGYIQKGAGTGEPRKYETSVYVVLNIPMMLRYGYELFLTANGVVLVYDDLPLECFTAVDTFPHLSDNIFNPTTGHTLPREVQYGSWRERVTPLMKYTEYLSPDEISKYIDPENGELVERRIPRNIVPKRRQTAWNSMDKNHPQNTLATSTSYLKEEKLKHRQAQHQLRYSM